MLIDAGDLLPAQVRREREAFLRGHAEESKIGLQVYLFAGDAELADAAPIGETYATRQSAAVLYFLGQPQRAGLYFGQPLAEAVPEAEQRRALQSSIMQAMEKAEPADQLEAFLSQMSVRLYWMEQMLDDGQPVQATAPVVLAPPAKDAHPALALPPQLRRWLPAAAALVVALPLLAWIYRRRMRYRLPVFDIQPRLGGKHAAGVGGVISFLNAEIPPAAQRDQMPGNSPRK
jgi:hypothetical protein